MREQLKGPRASGFYGHAIPQAKRRALHRPRHVTHSFSIISGSSLSAPLSIRSPLIPHPPAPVAHTHRRINVMYTSRRTLQNICSSRGNRSNCSQRDFLRICMSKSHLGVLRCAVTQTHAHTHIDIPHQTIGEGVEHEGALLCGTRESFMHVAKS